MLSIPRSRTTSACVSNRRVGSVGRPPSTVVTFPFASFFGGAFTAGKIPKTYLTDKGGYFDEQRGFFGWETFIRLEADGRPRTRGIRTGFARILLLERPAFDRQGMANQSLHSGIKGNRTSGNVGGFLRGKLGSGAALSLVSAYSTIYAYEALRVELRQIGHLRFLFRESRFIYRILALPISGTFFHRST